MSDTEELLKQSREALLDTAVHQLRLIHEMKRGQQAAQKPGRPALPRMIASDEGSDLLFELARLSVHSYSRLMKITSQHFDGIVEQLRGMTGTQTCAPPTPPQVALEVRGKPNDHPKLSTPFCIENPFRVPVEVSFSDPAFCLAAQWPGAETDRFHTTVYYLRDTDPPGPRLRPGQAICLAPADQVKLRAAVTLSKRFHPGQQYRGEAYVLSQGRVSGLLCFKVSVSAD